jgi:hypothetical protein
VYTRDKSVSDRFGSIKRESVFHLFLKLLIFSTSIALVPASLGMASPEGQSGFVANLSGSEEIPSVRTRAKGEITFQFNPEQNGLIYKLNLEDIENVTAAFIHAGKRGMEGEPVVRLFIEPKKEGIGGTLYAEGILTENELIGPLNGKALKFLLKMMKSGDTYVNVYTERNPKGAIRGQIEKQRK